MTLAEQLRRILPGILPKDPAKAAYGTQLLGELKRQLEGQYSENSILQTLSGLAADPTSPVARVERGYGYFLRPSEHRTPFHGDVPPDAAEPPPAESAAPSEPAVSGGRQSQPEEKFRAFYIRHARSPNRFPVRIEHTAAARQPSGVNIWKFPDVVVLDWDVGNTEDEVFSLDPAVLEVKRSLGDQPFRLTSVELKVELSLPTFREYFFQCVSNSMWAHAAHLVVACPVSDALLAQELRRLGSSYGVAVVSFDMTREGVSSLPSADDIIEMSEDDFEKLATDVRPTTLSPGAQRPALDWDHISDMMKQSRDFRDLVEWISRCLRDGKAYTFEKFLQLRDILAGERERPLR